MRKVTTVNLNGNAYQLEEAAFDRLRAYLDEAALRLRGNLDRAEILADLEQAIADKCDTCLGARKTVVSEGEVEQILREMGPVEGVEPAAENDAASDPAASASASAASGRTRRKRIYRLPSEGMLGGVCAGLAAYINVDVVWVRLAFVVLTFTTGGFWLLLWLVMLCIAPVADTAEEIADAHGEPLNAREVVDRAKKKSAEFAEAAGAHARNGWQRFDADLKMAGERMSAGFAEAGGNVRDYSQRLRERSRQRAAYRRRMDRPHSVGAQIAATVLLPFVTILSAALFVAFVFVLLSLLTAGHVLGFAPIATVPLWIAIAAICVVYFVIGGSVGVVRRTSQRYANGGRSFGWAGAVDALLWVGLVAAFCWTAWHYSADVRAWLQALPATHLTPAGLIRT